MLFYYEQKEGLDDADEWTKPNVKNKKNNGERTQ